MENDSLGGEFDGLPPETVGLYKLVTAQGETINALANGLKELSTNTAAMNLAFSLVLAADRTIRDTLTANLNGALGSLSPEIAAQLRDVYKRELHLKL